MAKVAVVGEAPSRYMEERRLFTPLLLASKELSALMAIRWPDEWAELVHAVNIFDRWPGKAASGKGDAFPTGEARRRAEKLKEDLVAYQYVVFLGRRVESAFGRIWTPFFVWERQGPLQPMTTCAPHPSKVSHWWNEPKNREAASAFWKDVTLKAR